jgi:hypothetical protein
MDAPYAVWQPRGPTESQFPLDRFIHSTAPKRGVRGSRASSAVGWTGYTPSNASDERPGVPYHPPKPARPRGSLFTDASRRQDTASPPPQRPMPHRSEAALQKSRSMTSGFLNAYLGMPEVWSRPTSRSPSHSPPIARSWSAEQLLPDQPGSLAATWLASSASSSSSQSLHASSQLLAVRRRQGSHSRPSATLDNRHMSTLYIPTDKHGHLSKPPLTWEWEQAKLGGGGSRVGI